MASSKENFKTSPEKENKKPQRRKSVVSNESEFRRSRLAARSNSTVNENKKSHAKRKYSLESRLLYYAELPATPRCLIVKTVIALNLPAIPPDVTNIDEKPMQDVPIYDRHYGREILSYMKQLEIIRSLPRSYLVATDGNEIINSKIRAVLYDWLIQVQNYLELNQETLHLCIKITDHFFSLKCQVSPDKLQLAASAALLISSKMTERFPPKVSTLVHLTDDSYTNAEVLKMEQSILSNLNFTLVLPEPMVFLDRCYQISGAKNTLLKYLSHFLVDLMITNVKSVHALPSLMAAAAFCLSLKILCTGIEAKWNKQYRFYSGYDEESLKIMMQCMIDELVHRRSSPYQGAVLKYMNKERCGGISRLQQLNRKKLSDILDET